MEDIIVWEVDKCKLIYSTSTGLLSKSNKFKREGKPLYSCIGIPTKSILYYTLTNPSNYCLNIYTIGRESGFDLLPLVDLTEEQTLSLITFMDTILSPNTTGAMEL